jgi:hypothetical protein
METIMHWLDPDYLPVTQGVVERFTVNLDGDLDGFVLSDRTLIHVPPHLSDRLKAAIRPGDLVRVRGVKPRGAELIAAVSIERAGGPVVVDEGPDAGGADQDEKPAGLERSSMKASGSVRLTLFAAKGQIRGALLEDGTTLRLGHKEAERFRDRLCPGSEIFVRGEGIVTEFGRVIEVREIGKADGTFDPIKKPKHIKHEDPQLDRATAA